MTIVMLAGTSPVSVTETVIVTWLPATTELADTTAVSIWIDGREGRTVSVTLTYRWIKVVLALTWIV